MKAWMCDVCQKQAPFEKHDYDLPKGWYTVRTEILKERHACSPACAHKAVDELAVPPNLTVSGMTVVEEPAHVG